VGFEVGDGEAVEAARAEGGGEGGEIVVEAVEEAEPILAIVDLDALEGGETVVGFDDGVGEVGGGVAVREGFLHAPARGEAAHHGGGEEALGLGERVGGGEFEGAGHVLTRRDVN
jgi:hypothetical protein